MKSVIVIAPSDRAVDDTSCDKNGWPFSHKTHDVDLKYEINLQQQPKSWDIKQKILLQPELGCHDQFDLWPDGECKKAYASNVGSDTAASVSARMDTKRTTIASPDLNGLTSSAAAAAAKHLTGWAMRNTNNHNPLVLKKSCLGLIVCSLGNRCPGMVRIRPAICDKARTKQLGKRCPTQGCNGTLELQRCKGNRQFPVTHFWRKVGETVFFQSSGTHDHPRPLVNNVENFLAAEVTEQVKKARKRRATSEEAAGDQEVPKKVIKTKANWCESHIETLELGQFSCEGFNYQEVGSPATNGRNNVHDNVLESIGHDGLVFPYGSNSNVGNNGWSRPTIAVTSPPAICKLEPGSWSTDWDIYGGYQQSSAFSSNNPESLSWQAAQHSPTAMSAASPISMANSDVTATSTYDADYHLMATSHPSPPERCMYRTNCMHYDANELIPLKWHSSSSSTGYPVPASLSDCGSADYLDSEDQWSPECTYNGSSPNLSASNDLWSSVACSNDYKWSFDECIIDGLVVMAKHAGVSLNK